MQIKASSVDAYISQLPDDRKQVISKLRNTILANLPKGFEETISYGMIGFVVPHSIYPKGYHANPKQPLPFVNIASQKNHIALYHMALYSDSNLFGWFAEEYSKRSISKLDMGKSCIRFKSESDIPYDLIAELISRISVNDYVSNYEDQLKNKKPNP